MFADTLLLVYFSVVYRNGIADNNGVVEFDENKNNERTTTF